MTGDQDDIFSRIRALLPPWFQIDTYINALLRGLASVAAPVFDLIAYAGLQMRVRTATDGWLDMIAADFFGPNLLRAAGQTDASFRNRILINILRERATRAALVSILTEVTGRVPAVVEPMIPADVGGYNVGGTGYGVTAAAWGSLTAPCWCFVRPYRPDGSGGIAAGSVTDAEIYAAIEAVRPAGVTVWVQIND